MWTSLYSRHFLYIFHRNYPYGTCLRRQSKMPAAQEQPSKDRWIASYWEFYRRRWEAISHRSHSPVTSGIARVWKVKWYIKGSAIAHVMGLLLLLLHWKAFENWANVVVAATIWQKAAWLRSKQTKSVYKKSQIFVHPGSCTAFSPQTMNIKHKYLLFR